MAWVVELSGHGLHRPSMDGMDFHRVKWLDIESPSDAELLAVAKMVGLPKRELLSFMERDELPRLMELDHFTVVMCKAPMGGDHGSFSTSSVSFFVSEKLLISLHADSVGSLSAAKALPDADLVQILQKGTSEMLYYLFEHTIREFFKRLDDVELQIDKIEDSVFTRPDQRTVRRIFSLKRTLIFYHKALAGNRDVVVALQMDGSGKHIKDRVQRRLLELYYDVVQLLDVVATYRDILTGTLDIYLSSISNNMNAVMKKMTAYGSLVLVPTFITGLYGMNFRFMPEVSWKYGYALAWGIIIVSVLLLFRYFRKRDWF